MKVSPKVIPKVFKKIQFGVPRAGEFLGGGLSVPLQDLIAWYKGTTSEDGTSLLAASGNHSGQVKGTSVQGDGTKYGIIPGLLTTATFIVGTGSNSPTCTTAGRLDIASGDNVWDLKVYHGGVLFADLAMICKGSTVEYSATEGLPDCTWSAGGMIVEHTDGSGSDRANEDGYGIDSSGNRVPYGNASAVTQYPGPIAADMTIVSGTAYPNLVVKGALGPRTQALTSYGGEASVDLSTQAQNIEDKEFVCTEGAALYSTAQDALSQFKIATMIGCSLTYNLMDGSDNLTDGSDNLIEE